MSGAAAITVTVARTRGSAPREAGAAMEVTEAGQSGSIGGGSLEWAATQHARQLLREGTAFDERTVTLGPDMGQCCGGVVVLTFSTEPPMPKPERVAAPLWIWGGGHVGRAVAAVMAPLADREITMVDTTAARLPDPMARGVLPLVAADPVRVVGRAPTAAQHLIVTFSHDLDLQLCDALLHHGFADCGLIGSATKWARFRKRLASFGHTDAQISRIHCPIGDPKLGKHPQAIAIGVAGRLLQRQMHKESADLPSP